MFGCDGSFFAHRQLHLRFLLTGASLRLDIGRYFCDFYRPYALRAAACMRKAVKFAQLRAFILSRVLARFMFRPLAFVFWTRFLKFIKFTHRSSSASFAAMDHPPWHFLFKRRYARAAIKFL